MTLSTPPEARRSNRSTRAMFFVPAPENLSRFPGAENSNTSAALDPVKTTRSLPCAALDQVVAALGVDRVVALAAEQPFGGRAAA